VASESLIATFAVPADHPALAGHFPGRPLVPGVMLLDWVFREAQRVLNCDAKSLQVRECKFFDPLLPTQSAELYFDGFASRVNFRIRRGDVLLAAGILEMSRG
jgi:3-hydroxyacyl-[acyl-carrier-protein] dehydratase